MGTKDVLNCKYPIFISTQERRCCMDFEVASKIMFIIIQS